MTDGPEQLCAFAVGPAEYAVDIKRVTEILRPPPITQVPYAPKPLEGVVNLRGEIVPVVDLRKALGVDGPRDGRREKLLVCLLGRRKVAVLVDRVTQVVRAMREDLKPVPAVGGGPASSPYVIGAFARGPRLVLLLNLRAVLAPAQA